MRYFGCQSIDCFVFCQSFRNASSPLSVRGCLYSSRKIFGGMVATGAPMRAAARTCATLRIDATKTSVWNWYLL